METFWNSPMQWVDAGNLTKKHKLLEWTVYDIMLRWLLCVSVFVCTCTIRLWKGAAYQRTAIKMDNVAIILQFVCVRASKGYLLMCVCRWSLIRPSLTPSDLWGGADGCLWYAAKILPCLLFVSLLPPSLRWFTTSRFHEIRSSFLFNSI